ncbi:MAG: PAS domain S-box protein [Pyrinomonadaceae bacterium]|nr:PAS domain S-box protein [Pyrinomonadaceae bacterium]
MKILIADNDASKRRWLSINLGKWGYQTVAVDDGRAALRVLSDDDAPSLAILNCEMPHVNGIEVCRRVRREFYAKPIFLVLMIPRNDEAGVSNVAKSGADDYLTEPVNVEALRLRIKNGERIIELQRNLNNRAAELETAITAIETVENDLQNLRDRQMLLESAIEQLDLSKIINTAEQTNVSILITNANLDFPGPEIVFVNKAFTTMTHYTPADVAGKSPRILQGEQTNHAVLKRLKRALLKGDKFFGETVNYRKDRTPYNLEWHISPLKNNQGEVTNFVSVQRDITVRKHVEAMMRESGEYRNLFHLANDSILIFDPKTAVVLNVNDKACDSYRISRENFVGMSLEYISLDRERDAKMLETLFTNGASEEFETVHLRGDGQPINVLINSSFVEFKGRQAILSINRDITERHRAESNIKRAKQEWSDTVDAVSDLIILEDSTGKIQRCNAAVCAFLNLNYSEIINKQIADFFTFQKNQTPTIDKSEPLRMEIWEGKIGEREDWYEITNHKLSSANSKGWVHIIKNITPRKQNEKVLRRLNTAIEQAADGIVIMDETGVIQFVNPAFERTSQFPVSEIIGNRIFDFKANLFAGENPERNLAKIAESEIWHGIYKAKRRTNEFYDEEAIISPVKDSDGNLINFVAVCRDVTEKKRLESIAEAVNMMENVGFIFSGIRHELGNPINSIKVALAVLKKNLEAWQTSQIKTYIERCLSETTRVEYLLQALKTFSMHENPKMQAVDLTTFMQNFVSLTESDFNKRGIQIVLNCERENVAALCDPRALHQVMLNLLANSADALEETETPAITIKIKAESRRVLVQIEDNGIGINEKQLGNLFKPFYTSKPEGTGLGLVIVKKMIAKMNGTITISSDFGVGTKVSFTLETAG